MNAKLQIVRHKNHADLNQLKHVYLHLLRGINRTLTTLAKCVGRLIESGATPEELVEWGIEAGYDEGWVRSVISRLLVASGKRRRAPGAGRRVSPEARDLATLVIKEYHEQAPKVLLAAYRFAKRQFSAKLKMAA